ncbi:MAG: methyltransferase domain-containing protein [Candidatus Dormibacteraeota bacterium]|nr:methyltransferase domain-containing protein [Candidatus Dormibacteraeota bacterium]
MADILDLVDVRELRREVQKKYREVAEKPGGAYHFHTGRPHAIRLGYPQAVLDQLPEEACEAFAGMANPFHWETPGAGERVVDLGSGGGMDTFFAALCVGKEGRVIGVDMTPEMLERSRRLARKFGFDNVEFREGLIEKTPVEDGWADLVISNGVINLCPDKLGVCREVARILRPGGRMMIADICIDKPIPESALHDIDLWTG